MRRFCLLGWCAALAVAFASPRPGLLWSVSALLLLGFTLALVVLFAGFLGRLVGARGRGVRWALLAGVIVLPAVVLGLHRLNPPSDRTQIERTVEEVATSGDPAYCESKVTTVYLEQTTGVRAPFADNRCAADAGRSSAESVNVTDFEIDANHATATVANHGGPFDSSTITVELVPCQVTFAWFWRRHRRGWQGRRPEGVAAPRRAVEDAARRGEGKPERVNVA